MRILLVADPQLIGNNEIWITKQDSDRNLRKSFESAITIVKPELVIFLGDLMDRGTYAMDEEFYDYLSRFRNIFKIPENVRVNYIPGDNDIGGDWYEKVDYERLRRFKHHFGNSEYFQIKNITFYNVDLISHQIPIFDMKNDSSISVIMSHFQVLPSYQSTKMLSQLQPPVVIFSAHTHHSREVFTRLENHVYNFPHPLVNGKLYNLTAFEAEKIYLEIEVPTCSYRMGTLTVGFAQAAFDGKTLNYSPMFFLSRYYQFSIYLIFILILIFTNYFINSKLRNNNFKYEKLNNQ